MKNLILIISLMLTSGILSAQFKIGVKAATPTFSANEASKEFYNVDKTGAFQLDYLSTKTSYAYGLSFYQDIGTAFLSADVLYRSKTVEYNLSTLDLRERGSTTYQDQFKEITVPVIAGWRKNNFKLGLGPSFTFKADRQYSLDEMPEISLSERRIDTGFQFQIGYIIKDRIHIDLRREMNFNQSGQDYRVNGRNLNLKSLPHTGSITVGIYL